MSATPNFGFEVPVGSDTVNLLTQNYPNWTSLDSILQAIKDAGVTTATETKVGTVHQLVRTVSSCNVLRFTATSNYASGDTFTVDGNAVTTTTPGGTSLDAGAFVINQSVIGVLNGSVLTLAVGGSSSDASGISYDNTGSGLTATNVQDAIDEVESNIPTVPASYAATAITYDPTVTGMSATNVQDAIDELFSLIGSKPDNVSGTLYHTTSSSFLTQSGITYNNVGGVINIPGVIKFTYLSSDQWRVESEYDCTVTLTPGTTYNVLTGVATTVQGSNPSANVTVVF